MACSRRAFPNAPGGVPFTTGGDDIANSGIDLGGQIYLVYNTNSNSTLYPDDPHLNDYAIVLQFDPATQTFTAGRTLSQSYYPLPQCYVPQLTAQRCAAGESDPPTRRAFPTTGT